MFKVARWERGALALFVSILVAGCGGGGTDRTMAGDSPGAPAPLAAPAAAVMPDASCSAQAVKNGTAVWVDGTCMRSANLFAAPPTRAPLAIGAGHSLVSEYQILDWAEKTYPGLFAPAAPPTYYYSPYFYRYYPNTGNYVGVTATDVYVLGPITGGQLARVGSTDDFTCPVLNLECVRPPAPLVRQALAQDSAAWLSFDASEGFGPSIARGRTAQCRTGDTVIEVPANQSTVIVVPGLQNGLVYSCTVSTYNHAGVSPSFPLIVRPTADPLAQRDASPTQSVAVTFTIDPQGQPQNYSYTSSNANITFSAGKEIYLSVGAERNWLIMAQLPQPIQGLAIGGFAMTQGGSPADGGFNFVGPGLNCTKHIGLVEVDRLHLGNSQSPDAVELRFTVYCDGSSKPAVQGTVNWGALATPTHNNPTTPIPAGMWAPPAGSLPESGNYVYLESEPGDAIGAGQTLLFTDSQVTSTSSLTALRFGVKEGQDTVWAGRFLPMIGLPQMLQGYYGNVTDYAPGFGGILWSAIGQMVYNPIKGWYAIDEIAYNPDGTLQRVKLRFEQHTGGATAALHGAISWTKP